MSINVLLAAVEAETPKTAFYVIGGILASWAVLVAAVGITRHGFPSTPTTRNAVMAITALLVAATLASSVLTS